MYAEVAWVLASSGTQLQSQTKIDPDYLPDYPSVSCDYDVTELLWKEYHGPQWEWDLQVSDGHKIKEVITE